MKLEPDFVTEVIGILYGRLTSPAEAALRAKCLDSIEEFLAWNFLRQDIVTSEPEIAKSITDLARFHVAKAETPRVKSGFDLESRRSLEELCIALGGVIKLGEKTYPEHSKAYDALVRFAAAKDPGDKLLRFELDIKM